MRLAMALLALVGVTIGGILAGVAAGTVTVDEAMSLGVFLVMPLLLLTGFVIGCLMAQEPSER